MISNLAALNSVYHYGNRMLMYIRVEFTVVQFLWRKKKAHKEMGASSKSLFSAALG